MIYAVEVMLRLTRLAYEEHDTIKHSVSIRRIGLTGQCENQLERPDELTCLFQGLTLEKIRLAKFRAVRRTTKRNRSACASRNVRLVAVFRLF